MKSVRRESSLLGQVATSVRDRRRRGARQPGRISDFFRRAAQRSAEALGSSWAFITALAVVATWAVTGPLFNYSDTWQLVINTGTTIVTFLMVFLIQNAQNRDAKAFHLKLDELIHALHGARNNLISLEDCTDEQLEQLQEEFNRLAKRRSAPARNGRAADR